MFNKLLFSTVLVSSLFLIPGCGDTSITSNEKVIKKEVKINDDGTSKTKETTIRENPDGTTTKTEKKTETKKPGDDDTIIKLPGIEVKKD